MIREKSYKKVIIIIFLVMGILAICNISNRYMFVDESVEVMLGKNIIRYGFPKAWDGNNLVMVGVNGNEFNGNLVFIRKNWLTSYITAIIQLILSPFKLNEQTIVGVIRTIFVLIGILGAIAYYFLVKKLTNNHFITLITLLLFCFSVPVLLYIRSIYYLAPVLTFTMSTLLFYLEYIDGKRTRNLIFFMLSAILLFHSFYPYFFTMIAVIGLIYLVYDRKKVHIRKFIPISLVIFAMTLPWYFYANSFLVKVEKNLIVSKEFFINSLLGYIWQIHAYFFPFIPLSALLLFLAYTEKRKNKTVNQKFNLGKDNVRRAAFIFLPVLINLFLICIVNSFLDTRRIITIIPFTYIVMAYMIYFIYKKIRHMAYFIVVLCMFTNILHVLPYYTIKFMKINTGIIQTLVKPPVPFFNADNSWKNKIMDLDEYINRSCRFESYLANYIEEISNDYDDADEGMVLFMKKYAKKNQKVYLIGYQFETLAYYTGLKVVNRLDASFDPLPSTFLSYPNANIYKHLTQYPILECDWIIERRLNSKINENAIWHNDKYFEKFYINYPDSQPWNEIWAHSFITDRSYQGITIYRNRLTTEPISLKNNTYEKEDVNG